MKQSLYIIDIFSFIFRAFYAIRPLHAPDGTPVNAVYGVITMLKRLIDTKKPDHLVVCMESKDKITFREEIYPEYKANRGPAPEELIPQIRLIEEFICSYPMPVLSVPGFEADDVIATLVNRYGNQPGIEVFIVSPDKDLMQLVDDNVFLYDTMKEEIMGPNAVIEKFGVAPDKVIEVQSLCGDPTDNIPGIPGIGIKTAAKLIQEFGNLETVLDNASRIKGKIGEKIASGRESAMLSRRLVTLESQVPLDIKWENLAFNPVDNERLNGFYKRLGFKSLISGSALLEVPPVRRDPAAFLTIHDLHELKSVIAEFKSQSDKTFVFDTETDALDTMKANLVGISFCFNDKNAYYIPIGHKTGPNVSLIDVREILNHVLNDPGIAKAAQNAKFDINVLARHGMTVVGLSDDTLIASYIINPEGSHSLDTLAMKYLSHTMIAYADVVKKGLNFSDIDIATATKYSAEDAWATFAILVELKKELTEMGVEKIYREIEIPLVPVLSAMERRGIFVDKELLQNLGGQFHKRLKELEIDIYKSAGQEFNINSPKQLCEILFTKLGLPVIKKTKTGASTDVDVLKALASMHDLPHFLLEYRTLSKLLSTYVEQLSALIHPETGRIHSSFNQAVVATGRLSSSDPNLQNIPIKGTEGRKIREVFIAPPGYVLFSADYSQIELRLLAAFSKDPHMMEVYQRDEDIHRQTAARIFGVELSDVTDAQRSAAKTINFGVIYGQSAFGLAQQLGVPREEASRFIEKFYAEFNHVREYKKEVLAEAKKTGFVSTFLGRRRYLPDLKSRNKMAELNAERAAFNAVFQGSAADLIKKAMLLISVEFERQKLKSAMLLQVHDELVFEVPEDEITAVSECVPRIMESAFEIAVPLKVSFKWGRNWGEAH